ncbi:UDP-2,3-diacylglucosamine diphosphatase [Aliikangiella sp. IMCC44632]
MTNKPIQFKRQCQSLFISDIHLGHKETQVETLTSLLKTLQPQNLFLLGDIVDLWEFKSGIRWPPSHTQLIKTILKMAKQGTHVFYIPGNHDAALRKFNRYAFRNILVVKEYIYTNKQGKKLLLLHGDRFDAKIRLNRFYGWLGDKAYDSLLWLNRHYNLTREKLNYPYWSLSNFLKENLTRAKSAIDSFAYAAIEYAHQKGCQGVICGHIHHPEIRTIKGIEYYNDGDWLENNSALIEGFDGQIELIKIPSRKHINKNIQAYPLGVAHRKSA